MNPPAPDIARRWAALPAIIAGAAILRLISGVGFANYDTLYALVWGGQISRGENPAYGVAVAPTPHPLVELLGVVLSPLSAHRIENVTVALAFLALSACGWVIYLLGAQWFGRAAGALAALIFLTRVPVLSYGVRAYVDLPYLLLVLSALLIEARRPRAGAPVLALLAVAGLLRPEAWAFSGLYWLYVLDLIPWGPLRADEQQRARSRAQAPALTAIAASAPLAWVLSDLIITGQPLWSLTKTRDTASLFDRETGIAKVPEYIPRRIGEILRPPVLLGSAIGGVLSLMWLRSRSLLPAAAGFIAVAVFALFASAGLPINSRYAFGAAAILCIFCGAGLFGWKALEPGDPRRRRWMAASAVIALALIGYTPAQYSKAHSELDKLARESTIEHELTALAQDGTINLRCGPVGVPNHAPIPLLALYLKSSPRNIVSEEFGGHIDSGVYVDPASSEVEADYVLDKLDPHSKASVPPGFQQIAQVPSWRIYQLCP